MEKFWVWFAESKVASFLRVFVTVLISSAVADFAKVGSFDFTRWESWLIASVVSATPLLLRLINPADPMGS